MARRLRAWADWFVCVCAKSLTFFLPFLPLDPQLLTIWLELWMTTSALWSHLVCACFFDPPPLVFTLDFTPPVLKSADLPLFERSLVFGPLEVAGAYPCGARAPS